MNIIDIIIIILLAVFVLNGVYRGFISAVMNLGGLFVSWVVAFLCYPLLAKQLAATEFFAQSRFYIEGAERIDVEIAKTPITSLQSGEIQTIVTDAKMPLPFGDAIVENINEGAFAEQGLTTVGDYFDETIFNVITNTLSLVIIFFAALIVITLVINAVSFSINLPQLRSFDTLAGGGVALIRGFFVMYMLFAIVPAFMVLIGDQITFITDMLNDSLTSSMFYNNSIVLPFVSGIF